MKSFAIKSLKLYTQMLETVQINIVQSDNNFRSNNIGLLMSNSSLLSTASILLQITESAVAVNKTPSNGNTFNDICEGPSFAQFELFTNIDPSIDSLIIRYYFIN
jgi:hypothetical protein